MLPTGVETGVVHTICVVPVALGLVQATPAISSLEYDKESPCPVNVICVPPATVETEGATEEMTGRTLVVWHPEPETRQSGTELTVTTTLAVPPTIPSPEEKVQVPPESVSPEPTVQGAEPVVWMATETEPGVVPNPVPAKVTVVVPSAFTGVVTEVTTGWTAITHAVSGEQVAVSDPEVREMAAAALADPSPPESVTQTSEVADEAPMSTAQATPPTVTEAVAGAKKVPVKVMAWFPVIGVRAGVTEVTVATT